MKIVALLILPLLLLPLLLLPACSKTYGSKPAEDVTLASLSIQADETPIDRVISDRVAFALQQERDLAPDVPNVRIATREGVVRLNGQVRNEAVKGRFGIVANAVGSVVRVDNQLTVEKN